MVEILQLSGSLNMSLVHDCLELQESCSLQTRSTGQGSQGVAGPPCRNTGLAMLSPLELCWAVASLSPSGLL